MPDALVSHPAVGSVWLQNATIHGEFVVGEVSTGGGYLEPPTETMNFPRTCVRRWSTEHAPDCEVVIGLGCCDCGGR